MEVKGQKLGLTVWGETGSLLEQGADDTMKTSSAPRSSSVSPLQERSTSAFSELSAVTMETEKQTKNQTISAQFIENSDAQLLGIAVLNKFQRIS